jgi:hypothetical protein
VVALSHCCQCVKVRTQNPNSDLHWEAGKANSPTLRPIGQRYREDRGLPMASLGAAMTPSRRSCLKMSRKIATAGAIKRGHRPRTLRPLCGAAGKLVRAVVHGPAAITDAGGACLLAVGERQKVIGEFSVGVLLHEPSHAIVTTSACLANDDQRPRTSDRANAPSRGKPSPLSVWSVFWRKVERGGRKIIPVRLSAPPRRLKSRPDFVWPKARPVVAPDRDKLPTMAGVSNQASEISQ